MKDDQPGGEPKITYSQMREAAQYVNSYIKFTGGDPALDYPLKEEDVPKTWPNDARKAWETVELFYEQNEGKEF